MSSFQESEASSSGVIASTSLDSESLSQLRDVFARVEQGRGVLVRLADLMGGAVGQAAKLGFQGLGLAPSLQHKLEGLSERALMRAFNLAILGMTSEHARTSTRIQEKGRQALVAVSGAVGGFGGLLGLFPDISFTTLAIMREIARIAQQEGEDLKDPDTHRACLEVFALRSFASARQDDESELGFFSARALMRGRPIVMLIAEVASHYGVGLSRKFALQMVPVAGALCGASLNAAFFAHYKALARAHFTIRRLERRFGALTQDAVRDLQSHAHGDASAE